MEQSSKWKLSTADIQKWGRNTLMFLAPVAIIYLGVVVTRLNDGVSLSDFALNPELQGMIALYVVNVAYDFFKKLAKGPQQ